MIRQTLGAFALAGGLLCAAADIEIKGNSAAAFFSAGVASGAT